MAAKMETLVSRWLHSLKIPVSPSYLRDKLSSHPDYPSLLSITDTLDELGIENASIVVDKEMLFEIPVPFLAHMNTKNDDFFLVTDTKKVIEMYPDFIKKWDGIAVMAEKPAAMTNSENEKELLKEGKNKQVAFAAFALLTGICLYGIFIDFNWLYTGLMITTLAGFAVSVLIVQHELGISNSIADQLCQAGKNTDCDAVLHSEKSKILNWINLADANFIWFCSLTFLIIISLFTQTVSSIIPILTFVTICTVPVTFISIYYQWRVVKKWCTLCLLTVGLLLIQAIILTPSLFALDLTNISIASIRLILLVLSFVAAMWFLLIKALVKREMELTRNNFSLLRFKKSPDVFVALLKQQREVDISPFEGDLQLGNPNAPIQIMVGCGLYCGPCAKAHKLLEEIISKNNIGCTIRLYVDLNYKEDKRTKTIEYVLQLLNNASSVQRLKILHDWYATMNFEEFCECYPLTEPADVNDQLKEHERWTKSSQIKFTPTIFINGYEMPKQYDRSDLPRLIAGLKDEIKEIYEKT